MQRVDIAPGEKPSVVAAYLRVTHYNAVAVLWLETCQGLESPILYHVTVVDDRVDSTWYFGPRTSAPALRTYPGDGIYTYQSALDALGHVRGLCL